MRKDWFFGLVLVACCGLSFWVGRVTTPKQTHSVVEHTPVAELPKPSLTRTDVPALEVREVIDLAPDLYVPSRKDLMPVDTGEIIPASFLPPPEGSERIPPARELIPAPREVLPAPREVPATSEPIPPPPELKGLGMNKGPDDVKNAELEKAAKILAWWLMPQ